MTLIDKNWKLILGICLILILGGGGLALQSGLATAKEKNAQEKFFSIEKKYVDYKTKKEAPDKTEKGKTAKTAAPVPPVVASAPPAEQLASIKTEFETFISDNPKSKATQMAALYFAEISRQENKIGPALDILMKVKNNDSGLVNTLVEQQIGQLLADSEKYQEAIDVWQKIINRKEAKFLHSELKIQQALCFQKLNNFTKAEELLTNIANQKTEDQSDATSVKEAARYLRLIQIKKVTGT